MKIIIVIGISFFLKQRTVVKVSSSKTPSNSLPNYFDERLNRRIVTFSNRKENHESPQKSESNISIKFENTGGA